jgi:hypothetical protein
MALTVLKGPGFRQECQAGYLCLVFGKEVNLHTHGKDKHGRTIADVLLPMEQMLISSL